MKRLILWASALLVSGSALAQMAPKLEPLPEPPPPPPGYQPDPALEPQVVIRKQGEDTVEEFRVNGQLYMIKVTPPHGVPYYLIDRKGDGHFEQLNTLDSRPSVPQWVIHRW